MSKALLVGINKYKIAGADLQGCINDITNVRDILLTYFGFTVKQIRIVVNERATKEAIIKRLHWLVKDTKPGDRLLFHFSGHGSQIRDRDGDELKDHLDEILCPHDLDWDGAYIVDDDLKTIFSGLPEGVNLEVLLDCCHSGSGTRAARGLQSLPEEFSYQPRFLPPPVDILLREEEGLPEIKLFHSLRNPKTHVLFSGCRDNQTSADAFIKGKYNGAFTYYFCKHLRDGQGSLTRGELLKRLRSSLKFNGFDQVPQLECEKTKVKKKILE